MELSTLTCDRETAIKKWKENIEAEKISKQKHFKELRQIYYQLSKGKRILDLHETLKKIPLNADGDPRIAITPIEQDRCVFRKNEDGGGVFGWNQNVIWERNNKHLIAVPANTWTWPFEEFRIAPDRIGKRIKNREIAAPTPIVPAKYAHLSVEGNYILWEVDKWQPIPPKDPLIIKRITANLFSIEARWNLTNLERAVMKGNL